MLRALFIYNHVIVIFINRLLHNIQCFDHSYLFYQGCQLLNIMSLLLVSRCQSTQCLLLPEGEALVRSPCL